MKRIAVQPRADWRAKVENVGLVFHTIDGKPYWDETAFFSFTAAEVDELEAVTNDLASMYQSAVGVAIERRLLPTFGIPEWLVPLVEETWRNQAPSVFGRFDLAYDGEGPAKLLEFNADTPTSLLEASVVQWEWLTETGHGASQWNSIHERLLAAWIERKPSLGETLHFTCCFNSNEDYMALTYLRDLAQQAGIATEEIPVEQIGWCSRRRRFVDVRDRTITGVCKLYPWDWMVLDQFGPSTPSQAGFLNWVEPAWKMLAGSKAMLALLWEMFPGHQNLLPCYVGEPNGLRSYARKPFFSREGANVQLVREGETLDETPGEYAGRGVVFQGLYDLPNMGGGYPILGSWVIDGESAGLGVRECDRRITDGSGRFVPHAFE